jgi:hypothetical protein
VSGLFSKPSMPAPQPVPVAPTAPDNKAAEDQRLNAERAAIADQKARGRASTVAAGGDIAAEEQYNRGLLKKKQRTASREMFG